TVDAERTGSIELVQKRAVTVGAERTGSIELVQKRAVTVGAERTGSNRSQAHVTAADASRVDRRSEPTQKITQPTRVKSDIPSTLRRKVKHRDHDKCRVPWCRSSRNVDCHHIRHVSQGGQHTFENLICLCESHHLAHHAGALLVEGTASTATFQRRAHNSLS